LRLAFVVQRYGPEVAGGSELHCRWLAERLARRHEVEVLTTCALDYLEWANHYPAGRDVLEGVRVTRYPVARRRSPQRFGRLQAAVFEDTHSEAQERRWVEENGPVCPALLRDLPRRQDVDLFLFYCYRYYPTFFGLPRVRDRAVLVPTAEDDPAVDLRIFRGLFRAPRGFVFLTPEERALVRGRGVDPGAPDVVIGSGVNVPARWPESDVHARRGLPPRYLLYVGRLDPNKGTDRLFDDYQRLAGEWPDLPPLVLAGPAALPVPAHPRIRHLGFVSEEEKFALLARCELLVMPSAFESLSVIVLEAWAMGRPVLVSSACKVLRGQCLRSGGGVFYRTYAEFAEALRYLVARPGLCAALGQAGQSYVRREYDWTVVEGRLEAFLDALRAGASPTGSRS
jgi:glycosyltransferase involved in cell wall biosynthesis